MDNRQRVNAIMHYEKYDRMPVVAFGYWQETLQKWHEEGHVSADEARYYADNNEHDLAVMSRLGFDFNWNGGVGGNSHLMPYFENKVLSVEPDGSVISRDNAGLIVKTKPGVVSIPAHVGTSLTGREAWEEMYLPKLTYSDARVDADAIRKAYEDNAKTGRPQYIHIGSLYGNIRNMLGVEELAYLQADDEDLYVEIINTVGELNYKVAEKVLSLGLEFDYAHFWEDICFKSGPLVRPSVFAEYVARCDMPRLH
ncbi:MAG: hypothetical protein II266_04200, partial [Clostridia bacterium]|nr:hypothetical protein [Clostridia bacterium]